MSHTKAEIPTISIAPWLDGSARDDVVEAVQSACKTYGFFQLVGHGIPLESQKQIFEAAKTFFELPMEEKMKLAKNSMSGRGYEAPGTQALQPGQVPDDKEAMRVGRDVPVDDPKYGTYLYGANRWPDLPDEAFKNPVMDYRGHILLLALEVMKILASGLPYSDDVFDEFIEDPVGSVKMLHYPPRPDEGPKIGAGAHTDFGAITLLLQHPGQEGLEVLHPTTDTWIPVPTRENTFVVNIGDVLGAWTNGLYRSATHRVINNSTTDRYSVPFFFDGTMTTKMSPLGASAVANGEKVKTVGEHFLEKFSAADKKL